MIDSSSPSSDALSRTAQAEAVAWLARLQAPGRNRALEDGLRAWLKASPDNAAAFEKATDLWNELGGVSASALLHHKPLLRGNTRARPTMSWRFVGAAAAMVALVGAIGFFGWKSDSHLSTGIGEQRSVTLKDGSRVALNTNTRVVVEPWKGTREVRLERGEAYFEVSKNPEMPFVVIAGEKQVVAIGTAFIVRLDPSAKDEKLSVTLIEGKVAVTGLEVRPETVLNNEVKASTLTAGQRMVIGASAPLSREIDLPKLDTLMAWRRGEVVLDNTSLKDAATELNRYTSVVLVIDDQAAANLPVSGIFRTGDSESFAAAVATLYGLAVVRESQKLVLSGKPTVR